MKNIGLLFLFSILFLFSSCSKDEAEILIDLTGEWTGEYGCGFENYTEIIGIAHDLSTGSLVATKITGDPCIGAGEVTFTGNYDGKASETTVVVFGRTEQGMDLRANGTLTVMDKNSIIVEFPGTPTPLVRN